MKVLLTVLHAIVFIPILIGQVWNGQDSIFLNEWINDDQEYYRIDLAEDGMFRINGSALESANIPLSEISGFQFQLFHNGEEQALYVSSSEAFSPDDYIEFFGQKNGGEIDAFLFNDPEKMQLNPEYSIFTDTSAYFLTWNMTSENKRYQELENDLGGTLPDPEPYYWHEEKVVNSNSLTKPTYNGTDNIRYSHFDITEGFGSALVTNQTANIPGSNIYMDGPEAKLKIRFGTNSTAHEISLKFNNQEKDLLSFGGYRIIDSTYQIAPSELSSSNTVQLTGSASTSDRQSIAFSSLKYPRTFKFNNQSYFSFELEASGTAQYLEIENFNSTGEEIFFYDLTNDLRIPVFYDGNNSKLKVLIPASSSARNCVLVNANSGTKAVTKLTKRTFYSLDQTAINYIIISSERLASDPENGGENWPEAYAQYRNSPSGGSFKAAVFNIETLYDQFSYGIRRNPLAIKNFAHWILKNWENPEYVFILGKGREYSLYRSSAQIQAQWESSFIPTFGIPGSDNLLTSAWESGKPMIPIGRLAAKKPAEIKLYLDKVMTHEQNIFLAQTIEDRQWMKNVLHLSGGSTDIQATIKSYLKSMENEIIKDKFGGNVSTFTKTSSDPISNSLTEEIFSKINDEGVSIVTFFGHSAVGTFDFSIEDVSNYQNFGKNPLTISLGCFSGNIHTNTFGISEEFVVQDGVGSIAFIASSGTAYISNQYYYAKDYYKLIGNEFYGESIGKVLAEVAGIYENNNSLGSVTLMEQLTLHGDPAVSISIAPGPDYTIDYHSVKIDPPVVNTYLESFNVLFDVVNLGSSVPDSFHIIVEHFLPNGTEGAKQELHVPSTKYADGFIANIPILSDKLVGKNLIRIKVDNAEEIPEFPLPEAELNNELTDDFGVKGFAFYVLDNSAIPVMPKEFSIVNELPVTLRASSYNAIGELSDYIFQIDTTEKFNSPLLESTKIPQATGLMSWEPELDFVAGQVYYWRVSPDSIDAEVGYVWNNSSFIYLPESKPGWNQSDHFQFLKDDFVNMTVDSTEDFNFVNTIIDYFITNKVWEPGNPPIVYLNNAYCKSCLWFPVSPTIGIVAIDSIGRYIANPQGGQFGATNPFSYAILTHYFYVADEATRIAMMDFLENQLPDGSQVILYTILKDQNVDLGIPNWANDSLVYGKNIFELLEDEGAVSVRELQQKGNVPYIFSYKKGKGAIEENIAEDAFDIIESVVPIESFWFEGQVNSTMVGPSTQWDSLLWEVIPSEIPENDTTFLNVYGLDKMGNESLLISETTDSKLDLSFIDSDTFPKLRLSFVSKDLATLSSADLKYWRVLYEGVPEAVLNNSLDFSFYTDTLQQGEELLLSILAQNISSYDMDSLLVRYTFTDENNQKITIEERVQPLLQNDSLILHLSYNTSNLSGLYQLEIEINPDKDQMECFYFNNVALLYFNVIEDRKNPVLDVTFDGMHILDGDIVSACPEIEVRLNDENTFLLLTDTSLMTIYIKYPNGTVKEISFSDPAISFTPASANGNEAVVTFTPEFDTDGYYELQVKGEDVSGNNSGDQSFTVSFRVIMEELISNVFNYPNPFSTSTQFIFTLTGKRVPNYMKIQIMTAGGSIVREIMKDELGPLKIGLNRTDYRWDGTDEYGSKLANGVYFYRVVTKNEDGEAYEKFENGTNSFFKHELGKMVILR